MYGGFLGFNLEAFSSSPGDAASPAVGVTVRRERRWASAGATPARELVRSTR
jgi:hypothetical protein